MNVLDRCNEEIKKAGGPTPTHALNPETGLYDRTPEFKAWWEKLSDAQQRALLLGPEY